LLVLAIVSGLMQVIGIGSILPFMGVLMSPGVIQKNRLLGRVYTTFGFHDSDSFLLFLGIIFLVCFVLSISFLALTEWGYPRKTGHLVVSNS
jgi:hypothetical protein